MTQLDCAKSLLAMNHLKKAWSDIKNLASLEALQCTGGSRWMQNNGSNRRHSERAQMQGYRMPVSQKKNKQEKEREKSLKEKGPSARHSEGEAKEGANSTQEERANSTEQPVEHHPGRRSSPTAGPR